jgi:hypothetical protein
LNLKAIASDLNIALKTVYRLRVQFTEEDGTYETVSAQMAVRQAFTRDQLVLVSSRLTDEPKLTLKEIRAKLVEEGEYSELSNVPDASTLWRQM